jgi:hypothetical protein
MAKKQAKEGEFIPKRGRGQPTKYTPEVCDTIVALLEQGKDLAHVAAAHNVSERTLYNWLNTHDELKEAYEIAQAKSKAFWLDKADEYIAKGREVNATLMIARLSNKGIWKRNADTAPAQNIHIENMQVNNEIKQLSTDELQEKLQKKLEILQQQGVDIAVPSISKDVSDE